ncbi:TPA: M14 family metallopeptidase [Enterococcus faecium]
MELDQFRDVDLVIDYANYSFIEKQFVSQGDYKGRTLTVQVTNNGVVGEVPGLMLNLNWHNEASGLTDLSAFSVLDKANSIYRIEYPQNMMTPGRVIASIQIIQNGKVTNLKQFELTVQRLAGQPVGIVEKAEFSALVAIMADSNKFRTDIDRKADKSEVRLKSVKNELEDMSPTVLAAIQGGEGSSFNLLSIPQDGSVTPEKTTFTKVGKNKFNGEYIYNATVTGGFESGMAIVNRTGGVIAIVKVEGGKTYTVSKGTGGNRFRLGSSPSFPVFYDVAPAYPRFTALLVDDSVSKTTVTIPENDNYLIIYLQTDGSTVTPEWLQVEEGDRATNYTPPKVVVDLEERSIEPIMVKKMLPIGVLVGNKQTFNVNIPERTFTASSEGFFLLYEDKGLGLSVASQVVNLKDTKTTIVLFDLDERLFEPSAISELNSKLYNGNKVIVGSVRIDTPNNYHVSIFGNHTVTDNGTNAPVTENSLIIPSDNFNDFVSVGSFIPNPNNINDVYSIYDELVSNFPQYVSRTLLANNSDGLPIYRYDFKPLNKSNDIVFPKILYIANTHGHEKQACIGGARFFKELCNDWQSSDVLRVLRFNAHLISIPLLNPTGFNEGTRVNANGVDLNRNYPEGWENGGSDDPSSIYYRGTAPLSEIETSAVYNILQTEKDLIFVIDHHNSGSYTWLGSNIKAVRKQLMGVGQLFTSYLVEDNVSPYNYVVIQGTTNGSTTSEVNAQGINGCIIETSFTVTNNGDLTYDQKHTVEVVGNVIINALRKQTLK